MKNACLICTIAMCRQFAANVGMSFKTPQEAFGEKGSGGTGANAKLVAVFSQLADKYKGTENRVPLKSSGWVVLERYSKLCLWAAAAVSDSF